MARLRERIRGEIDDVREDLGETLEAIGDRVAPKRVAARAKGDAAEKIEGVKEKLSPRRLAGRGADARRQGVRRAVGTNDDSGAAGPVSEAAAAGRGQDRAVGGDGSGSRGVARRARGAASSVTHNVSGATDAARQRAEGNPLAAGLLAFAGGFFAAALLPPTERERRLTQKAKEGLQPLVQSATEAGRSMAKDLQSTAKARLQETVKETATDVAKEVMGRAQSGASQVKEATSDASGTVARRAKKATKKVQTRAKGATKAVKSDAKKTAKQVRGGAKGATSPTKRPSMAARSPRTGSASRVAAAPRRRA